MKPSISIDLPGWCTLRDRAEGVKGNTSKSRPESLDETVRATNGFGGFSSIIGSSNGYAMGKTTNDDMDDQDSDDGDDADDADNSYGAIARLFSIEGVKRPRSSSDSHKLFADGEGPGAVGHRSKSARAKRQRGAGGSAASDRQAEAYIDWPCERCTFINAYDQEACQGCGGCNRKRERLLKERREAVERQGRRRTARECRDRSLKEEALKDVLEDSSDSETDANSKKENDDMRMPEPTSPRNNIRRADVKAPEGVDKSEHTLPDLPLVSGSTRKLSQPTAQATATWTDTTSGRSPDHELENGSKQHQHEQRRHKSGICSIGTLPPDLLLQCSEFLGDLRSLCRVREVSRGWLVSLDDREAGQRLWRPVFHRLRADGSIHVATDSRGQQRRQLKVYDLGSAVSTPSTSAGSNRDGAGMLTPSPARRSSLGGMSTGRSAGEVENAETATGTIASTGVTPRRSSACLVCGLLQREGYSGRDCEMCASSLLPIQNAGVSSPALVGTPRLAYTRVNLTGSGGLVSPASPALSVGGTASSVPIVGRFSDTSRTGPTVSAAPPSVRPDKKKNISLRDGGDSGNMSLAKGGIRREGEGEGGAEEAGDLRNVDWHFLVKRLTEEKRTAQGWGSLHHGWVWLQRALQTMLHRRRGDVASPASPSRTISAKSSLPPDAGAPNARAPEAGSTSSRESRSINGNERGGVHCSAVGTPSSASANRDANMGGDLDPTISRLVRKLASRKWVLLYDSLKATFTLQAQGMAREVMFQAMDVVADAAVLDATGSGERLPQGSTARSAAAEVEVLRRCLAAWEAYKDWGEEVDVYCEVLNEQISAERYRTAGAGCGRGDNTPFARDTALLSFRHSFALNVQICAILRSAISKGISNVRGEDARSITRKSSSFPSGHGASSSNPSPQGSSGGGARAETVATGRRLSAAGAEDAEELFTDLELVEDSRAIDFSVNSFSGSCGKGRMTPSGRGKSRGRKRGRTSSDGICGSYADDSGATVGKRSGQARPGHYYDWFLSKLEGKEAGIIRGDIDARGRSLVNRSGGANGKNGGGQGGSAVFGTTAALTTDETGEDLDGLRTATLEDLLELVRDMVEELDVPDDHLSKDRRTQGAMRRLLFLPIKRWQAAVTEANAEDPQSLLMAGLSPAPGKEGYHRLRGGAAGRRRGAPPLSALGKDAGKSWEQLSSFFG